MELGNLVLDISPSKENPRNSEGAFLETDHGELLFAYSRFNGASWHDDAACDIALIRSHDNGLHWSREEIIVHAKEFKAENVMSVSALRLNNGDLAFFFLIKKKNGTIDFGLIRTDDDGASFLPAAECGRKYIPGYYVMNNDRVERLKNGRVIFPLGQHRMAVPSNGSNFQEFDSFSASVFFEFDEQHMEVRALPGKILLNETGYSSTGVQEPGIIELKNGVIWAYCRTDRGAQYESFSIDEFQTFTPVRQSRFTSPPSPMKIKRNMRTGTLYSVWNPIPNYNGRKLTDEGWGRTPFVIAKSLNDGYSWSPPKIIEDDEKRGYCYPALHFTQDDSLLIAYCRGGEGDGSCLNRLGIRKIKLSEI